MTHIKDTLLHVAMEPGLCSKQEIDDAIEFYYRLDTMLDAFKYAHTFDPQGLTIKSIIDKLKYYHKR